MTSLGEIIASLAPGDAGWRGTIPDTWLQGRTSYGGLSAALALHAALHSDVDLPPLRSAQVSFIGPLAGEVTITAQRLRRGRNAAFVQADVSSEAGLGLRATFVFMAPIASAVDYDVTRAPDFPCPAPGDRLYSTAAVPFVQNFEFVDRRDDPAIAPGEWLRWTRLKQRGGLDPMVELIAVADGLPPGALKLLGKPAPMSSLTWILNVLDPAPATTDGWWLLRSQAEFARAGSSSQVMGVWNADGRMIADQMQAVALFG